MIASQALRVATRDVRVEWSGHEAVTVVVPLAAVTVLLAGLGFGPRPDVLAAVGPGLPWLVVLFAAVPLARGVAAAERAEGCWDLLRSLISPASLLAGKVLAMWLWLAAVWLVATVLSVALLNVQLSASAIVAGPLGALGVAAVTVIFGTLLAGVDGRSGLLGVLLFPAGLPAFVAGGQAGTPGVAAVPWLAVLAAYDLIVLSVAWAIFPLVLEE